VLGEGTEAPTFELPGVVEGRPVRVRLDSLLGESVVVLVFYPADFNPSCTDETTDLDEFDVFGMQSDATVLGVSGDSVYSHRAFADAYDLKLPLLADVDGEVARSYGVTAEDGRYPTRRAVVVIDHEGQVTYTWVGADIEDRPDVEAVQTAFAGIDDANLAETQYREGCDRYDEATEMFVEGVEAYRRREWVLARGAFDESRAVLSTAAEQFERAVRFSEVDEMAASFEQGRAVTEKLDRGVALLADAAAAHANGDPQRGESLRREAKPALGAASERGAPPSPGALPVDTDDQSESTGRALGIDLETELGATPDERPRPTDDDTDETPAAEGSETAEPADTIDEDDDLDENDIDALTAEIETQDVNEG
jgi:peroxiredoxin